MAGRRRVIVSTTTGRVKADVQAAQKTSIAAYILSRFAPFRLLDIVSGLTEDADGFAAEMCGVDANCHVRISRECRP